jgi:hypothetical protein
LGVKGKGLKLTITGTVIEIKGKFTVNNNNMKNQ